MNVAFSAALTFATMTLWTGATTDQARLVWPPPAPAFAPPRSGVLFADDFRDGDLKSWVTDREQVWSVHRGMLRAELPDQRQERSFIYVGSEDWTNYAVDLDVCQMRGVDKGLVVRVNGEKGIGADLRGPGYHDLVLYRSQWPLGKAPAANGNAMWHHLRIEAREHRYRVFVNGRLTLEKRDPRRSHASGRIALPAYTGGIGECTVYYDNVVVTALE